MEAGVKDEGVGVESEVTQPSSLLGLGSCEKKGCVRAAAAEILLSGSGSRQASKRLKAS
jgi:hypothetical protein